MAVGFYLCVGHAATHTTHCTQDPNDDQRNLCVFGQTDDGAESLEFVSGYDDVGALPVATGCCGVFENEQIYY